MSCGIYMIKNKINNHMYIGLSGNIEERWKQHIQASFNPANKEYNLPLHKAIRKYGQTQFDFIILELCSSEELSDKEKYYIKKFNTFEGVEHYNLDPGGRGRSYRYKHNSATKEKMRLNHADVSGGQNPQAKAVYCIEKDIILPSCAEMAEYLGLDRTNGAKRIATVARGEGNSYYNYHFIWANEISPEKIQEIYDKKDNGKPKK